MDERTFESYDDCFSLAINEKSIEKIYNKEENPIIQKCINSKKYNKKLFDDILYSLENIKNIDKKTKLIDKIKYGIKPGKQWTKIENVNDKKDTFIQRFSCSYFYSYPNQDKSTNTRDVIYKLIENTKKDVAEKCKKFEPIVRKEYPSSKAKFSFSKNEEKEDNTTVVLLNVHFEIFLPINILLGNQSSESLNENIEQNDINSRKSNLFSIEDDDSGSFEEAAGEENDQGGNEQQESSNTGAVQEPDMPSMDDGGDGWGDDSGGGDDSGWGDDGNGDDSGNDENGGNEGNDKKNVFDSNIGSSMNPFTQINQKLYQLETLNELRTSIKRTIDLYNAQYADWSEVCQLKELLKILDEERKSFMMQQNPENLLKLGLYQKQYDNLVQNISKRISRLTANDRQ